MYKIKLNIEMETEDRKLKTVKWETNRIDVTVSLGFDKMKEV